MQVKKDKFAPSTSAPSSSTRDAKYLKLKEKYRKMKTQRKGRGLVAEDHDWADSSDEEDNTESPCHMALNDEIEISLMVKLEEVPEEIPEAYTSSASTSVS